MQEEKQAHCPRKRGGARFRQHLGISSQRAWMHEAPGFASSAPIIFSSLLGLSELGFTPSLKQSCRPRGGGMQIPCARDAPERDGAGRESEFMCTLGMGPPVLRPPRLVVAPLLSPGGMQCSHSITQRGEDAKHHRRFMVWMGIKYLNPKIYPWESWQCRGGLISGHGMKAGTGRPPTCSLLPQVLFEP